MCMCFGKLNNSDQNLRILQSSIEFLRIPLWRTLWNSQVFFGIIKSSVEFSRTVWICQEFLHSDQNSSIFQNTYTFSNKYSDVKCYQELSRVFQNSLWRVFLWNSQGLMNSFKFCSIVVNSCKFLRIHVNSYEFVLKLKCKAMRYFSVDFFYFSDKIEGCFVLLRCFVKPPMKVLNVAFCYNCD